MSNSIDKIEGIGPAYKEKFIGAGITTTEKLLEACATKSGRKETSTSTGFSEQQLLTWTNMADLMRIKGVGGEFAELMVATGVDTVKELATRNPENLTIAMESMNNQKKLTRVNPSSNQVSGWVEEAKTLEAVITH